MYFIPIKLSGEIEKNPGPQPKPCSSLSIWHWNLNSIPTHNFIKMSLLRAYISVNKFDILCLSKTYLDSSISSNDGNLEYTLVRADNTNNTEKGGVCIYCLTTLLPYLFATIESTQFLNECINFEIIIGGKMCNFLCLYRSPSQTRDIFETFADNLELTLDTLTNKNPFLIVVIRGFNAKTTN